MLEDLKIISYPDPRLRRVSVPVKEFGDKLGDLVRRMFELMREAKGVGLAAPQVGYNIRLFIVNHTQQPEDDRVYVNPVLFDAEGEEISSEGCLSLPGINVDVTRAKSAKMQAMDVNGKRIEQVETDYVARIWQHELDHLNGILLIDHMGPTAKVENRKILKELEEKYVAENREEPRRKV
jgi:peptide deformylase